MAAQTLPLSLEEFHRLYDGAKPAYEYWDGVAVRKPMPTSLHGVVQYLIMKLLGAAGWNTASEVRLKIVPDAEPIPHVIAIRGKYQGRYPASAPDLCVEILSPGDTLKRTFQKAARYIQWGTESVWVIDAEKRTAWIVQKGSPEPTWIPLDGVLQIGDTAISLSVLFAEIDNAIELSGDPD